MEFIDADTELYALEHSTVQDSVLEQIAENTRQHLDSPSMMIGQLEGMFLEMLVFAIKPDRVLEIGTFSGYSCISMAKGLKPGATIDTLENDNKHVEIAKAHIKQAGLEKVITIREGDARQTIQKLTGPYQFIFIDADKTGYEHYLKYALELLSPDGIIAVDNTLWSKRVLDPTDSTEDTLALRDFNNKLSKRTDIRVVISTIRDGVTLIRKTT